MAYILIDPKILEAKGISYEKMPDGRAIAETNILKVLGSVSNVEFVSTTKELNDMVEAQKKERGKEDKGKVENQSEVPQEGQQTETEGSTDVNQTVPEENKPLEPETEKTPEETNIEKAPETNVEQKNELQ